MNRPLAAARLAARLAGDSDMARCTMTPETATHLHRAGRLAEAEAAWRQVLARRPGDPQALGMLGTLAWQTGRTAEGCQLMVQSLRQRPDAGLFYNLGLALRDLGHPVAALDSFGEAVALRPGFADAHAGRGLVLLDMGFAADAEQAYAQAESLSPKDPEIASGRLLAMQYLDLAPTALTEAHRAAASRLFGTAGAWMPARDRGQGDPLRVGFVSGDLRRHPVGLLLEGVAAHFPAHQLVPVFFPTHAYQVQDPVAATLRATGEWIPLEGLDDDDAATRVRAAGIDVLIDLSGHTGHHRLGVFARRAAPVQATWLGYTATTGLAAMDAILCDRAALPDADRGQYAETPWPLPARLCFTPPADAPEPAPSPAAAALTFGCFNNVAKVGPRVVQSWSALLNRVPDSRLLFKGRQLAHAKVRSALEAAFASHGVAPERLVFDGFSPRGPEYWASYGPVDVALDPFPFNGGTTTLDTLWMGVPVVSMRGDRMAARQGESILGALGLNDWLAEDTEDYIRIAAALAADPEARARFRVEARTRLRSHPMADPAHYAAGWAKSIRALHRHVAGRG